MANEIVTRDYNDGGWEKATQVAGKFGKCPVLYCVASKSGVVKVGRTKNIEARLCSYGGHGLNWGTIAWVLVRAAPSGRINGCETRLVALFKAAFVQVSKESFLGVDRKTAKALLKVACRHRTEKKISRRGYAPVSGGPRQDTHDFRGKALSATPTTDAVDFVLFGQDAETMPDWNEDDFYRMFDALPMNVAELVPPLAEFNNGLICAGLDYDKRKPMIKQYAMDWRLERSMGLLK